MSRFALALQVQGVHYHGIKGHFDVVLKYLNGTRRARWQADDLVSTCELAISKAS